jgi:hypothetical protein
VLLTWIYDRFNEATVLETSRRARKRQDPVHAHGRLALLQADLRFGRRRFHRSSEFSTPFAAPL